MYYKSFPIVVCAESDRHHTARWRKESLQVQLHKGPGVVATVVGSSPATPVLAYWDGRESVSWPLHDQSWQRQWEVLSDVTCRHVGPEWWLYSRVTTELWELRKQKETPPSAWTTCLTPWLSVIVLSMTSQVCSLTPPTLHGAYTRGCSKEK